MRVGGTVGSACTIGIIRFAHANLFFDETQRDVSMALVISQRETENTRPYTRR